MAGTYPESRLSSPLPFGHDVGVFIGFPHGHGGFYLIPGFDEKQTLLNWAIYDAVSVFPWGNEPTSLPPGSVDEELAAALETLLTERYPRRWADVVRRTDRNELSVQPIYDMPISTYVTDRALLIGDAATVVRPHTASGATKAMQDALALEVAVRESDTWTAALARYNDERCAIGNSLVDLGRRLGLARVEETPDWTTMSQPAFRTWMMETTGGTFIPRYGS